MARLWTCGLETGDINEAGTTTVAANSTFTVVSSSPTPRVGGSSYCLKFLALATATGGTTKSFALPTAKTDVWVRTALFVHNTGSTSVIVFLRANDAAGGGQTCLTYSLSDGLLRAHNSGNSSGILQAASSVAVTLDSWHVIEWHVQITSTTLGTTEVWLDGTQVINFSGDNTQTTTPNVLTIEVGNCFTIASATGVYLAFDDIAINDTTGAINNGRPGDGRVVLLTPSGAGSSTQLNRAGTDSGANWSQVEELPPSMTDYVTSSTAANRDLYAMTDVVGTPLGINVVEELVLARKSNTGAASVGATIKSGATINEATAVALPFPTESYVTGRWETDPNTGAAWTLSAVNAIEAGVTVR